MSARDQVLHALPNWDQMRVREARILVVGAGALGNEVLKNLALLNVKRLVIVDFDRVETSNLSRSVLFRNADAAESLPKAEIAAKRLLDINPELEIVSLNGDVMSDVGLGLLRSMDVAIGCVDNRLARLYLNRWCFRAGIPWVNGGILNLAGQVSSYKEGHACYECGLTEIGWRDIRARMGCTDMAQRYAMQGQAPTTPIAASIIGAVQAQEALKLIMGQEQQSLLGRMFSYEGAHNHSEVYETLPPREHCDSHYYYENVVQVPELSANATLEEVFAVLRQDLGLKAPEIQLDHPVGLEVATLQSKKRHAMVIPLPHLSERVAAAVRSWEGEAVGIPRGQMVECIGPDFPRQELRLIDLGVPYWHILRVRSGKKRVLVELSGDAAKYAFRAGHQNAPNPWFEFVPEVD